jgi:hypothetical protein
VTRALLTVAVGFVLMVVMGALLRSFGLMQVSIDVALILVLYTAMVDRRGQSFRSASSLSGAPALFDGPSVAVALALGYFADLLGGGVKGVFALSLALVFVGGRALTRHVFLVGPVAQIFFTFVASVATSLVVLGLRWLTDVSPEWGILFVLLAQATLTAIAAPFLMGGLRWLDARLFADRGDRLGAL